MSRDFGRLNSKSSYDSKETINIIQDQSDGCTAREIRVEITDDDISENEIADERYSNESTIN